MTEGNTFYSFRAFRLIESNTIHLGMCLCMAYVDIRNIVAIRKIALQLSNNIEITAPHLPPIAPFPPPDYREGRGRGVTCVCKLIPDILSIRGEETQSNSRSELRHPLS